MYNEVIIQFSFLNKMNLHNVTYLHLSQTGWSKCVNKYEIPNSSLHSKHVGWSIFCNIGLGSGANWIYNKYTNYEKHYLCYIIRSAFRLLLKLKNCYPDF